MASEKKLFNRDFILLWQGQAVSQIGNQAFTVAMMFWTMEKTGSATLMGLLMMASSLPGALLAPLGGAVSDRLPRLKVIVVADALSGLALGGLALAFYFGNGSGSGPVAVILPLLFGVSVLLGTLMAFLNPAVSAAIPDLVPPSRLAGANSLNQLVIQAAIFLGQGVGGVLYRFLGAPLLFALDAISFLYASSSEALIRLPEVVRPRGEPGVVGGAWGRFFGDVAEGFRYVGHTPGLGGFLAAASSFNFFSVPLLVLLPFYVRDVLGREADWYGYLLATVSLGAVLGFVVAGTVSLDGRQRSRALAACMLAAPGTLAALGVIRSPWTALAVALALGVMTGLINIQVVTTLQATTPEHLRGRVMGLLTALTGGLVPLGMAVGGVVGDLLNKNVPVIALGCGAAALLLTALAVLRPTTLSFLAYEVRKAPVGGDAPARPGPSAM